MTTIHTVGHSTRTEEEFRELLQGSGVKLLVDVRQYPASRRSPHFAAESLPEWLGKAGIDYMHEVDLGGRRPENPNSVNMYWRNASFRAYADYMATGTFHQAIDRLVRRAAEQPTAIMCAESVPWRCHRWLISDVLVNRGFEVVHILNADTTQPHVLNPNARQDDVGNLIYPGDPNADDPSGSAAY